VRRPSVWAAVLAVSLALVGCSSSSHSTTTAAKASGSGSPAANASSGVVNSSHACPSASAVSTAMGATYKGPVKSENGTAGCVYDGPGTDNVEILYNAPGLSESQFAKQAGPGGTATKQPLSGYGKAAFITTAYGQSQVNVYDSASDSFSVVVVPANPTQAKAVAHAVLNS
jgi:hypothetical protein